MGDGEYNPLNGVKARLFYWPDPVGDTWVVAVIMSQEKDIFWYPLSVSSRMEDCLDSVMDLNKSLEDRGPWKKQPQQADTDDQQSSEETRGGIEEEN